jgi:pSer/pThr/pTyr-binding forkhead associated (FHA) protein
MANALRFKQPQVPRQEGERARLKVVKGPDFGVVFVLRAPRLTLGRGEDNDVVLGDLKASRHHAELQEVQGAWSVKDSGSSNGILIKGSSVRSAQLRSGDVFALGETEIEFLGSETGTRVLVAPPNHRTIQENRKRIEAITQFGGGVPQVAGQGSSARPSPVVILLVLAGAVLFFIPSESPQKKQSEPETTSARNVAGRAWMQESLPQEGEIRRTADKFFKTGFREYREKNYIRAQIQFETVLQIDPTHRLSQVYLDNCRREILDEVNRSLTNGKRSFDAGKLKEAKGQFESVLRLLYRDIQNPLYIEAKDQLDRVTKAIKGTS